MSISDGKLFHRLIEGNGMNKAIDTSTNNDVVDWVFLNDKQIRMMSDTCWTSDHLPLENRTPANRCCHFHIL